MTLNTPTITNLPEGTVTAEPVQVHAGIRKRAFAWLVANCKAPHERAVATRKRELLRNLSGTIVEIGPGTGANLEYYGLGVRWIGIEPNPHMHPYLKRTARALGMNVELRKGSADHLDFADGSVDSIVSTLVFCSVENVAASLGEIRRVLKPGGDFVFLEHVAATDGSGTRQWQRWMAPFSSYFADGCHPDRETWKAIENAGFSEVCMEHFRVPLPLIGPHIAGVATK
jgi:ubiquinone/menaquinone biosynthesis C-methylase UbiE